MVEAGSTFLRDDSSNLNRRDGKKDRRSRTPKQRQLSNQSSRYLDCEATLHRGLARCRGWPHARRVYTLDKSDLAPPSETCSPLCSLTCSFTCASKKAPNQHEGPATWCSSCYTLRQLRARAAAIPPPEDAGSAVQPPTWLRKGRSVV